MKKYLALALAIFTLFLVGCKPQTGDVSMGQTFTLKGIVKANENQDRIEVEIIESDYAYGIYWVLINNGTQILDADGNKISQKDLAEGDIVEITYGGQVMMSYPPQIVAKKVKKI